ncbi:MAG: putative lipopolysaccharide heptosyltransferase III [Parachlamydiales bacterium]|nr:putative lipopolysaccharide heptosyltransferase III [Parachlamydiales bacterium]
MGYTNYIDTNDVKKILVVKYRHLGDILLSTSVFYNLKRFIPHAKVDALIYKDCVSILKNNPYVDDIFYYDRSIKKLSFFKKLVKELKLLFFIKKQKYDLVINLTEGDRGAIIAFFSKAKYKVGFFSEKKGLFKKEKIFTHLVKSPKTNRHAVERNLDALRIIGIFPEYSERKLIFHIPKKARHSMKVIFEKNNIKVKNYVLIHPNTRWRFKYWDKFDQLIKFHYLNGDKIIIVSGNDEYEKELVKKIIKDIPALDLTGKTSIDELAYLIAMSKMFYAIDSFSYHLANALKANLIALFGPTCDISWGPWQNKNAKIVVANVPCRPCHIDGCGGSKVSECMKDISLEDVISANPFYENIDLKLIEEKIFCNK